MTTNTSLLARQQSLTPGVEIELFVLDASMLKTLDGSAFGNTYRFCSSYNVSTGSVSFDGNLYTPIAVEAEGFEVSGKGRLPTPKLRIANTDLWGTTLINSLGDPIGAKVTRFLTFDRYLDGGVEEDGTAIYLPQIFVIERKVSQTREFIEFELSASMDQAGRMLPKRQILRDNCTHIYRRWDATAEDFDYSKATCPYTDTLSFTNEDQTTDDDSLDSCGKRLNSCKLRFEGQGLPLPTRAFPGVARIRVRR